MDLVHTASATLINQTKQHGNIVEFMESPYKERRLKKKVWIKKADSVNGWETVETTPIQEVYKSVRREIENSRAMSTDARNGYTYLEEIAQDGETGEKTQVYKRLIKYADLGGCAMVSQPLTLSAFFIQTFFFNRRSLYGDSINSTIFPCCFV